MAIDFPDLPYSSDALEPFLSKETLETHHGKHHRAYVGKLNTLIEGTEYADRTLSEIVLEAYARCDTAIFNNAAQALNHSFLWDSMSPDGGGQPTGPLGDAIDAAFGDFSEFSLAFRNAASAHFGSGWVWLVFDASGSLKIVTTGNADTPILGSTQPLLTLDVWEHAYYLDYKNDRGRYIDAFLSDYANWQFAARQFQGVPAAA